MPLGKCNIPVVTKCCYCVTDLRAAAAIIAVLAIVTNPALSWAAVRHSYVIRVSCIYKTNQKRPDVVDISFNNVISFGFGANAGQESSCLKGDDDSKNTQPESRRSATVESVQVLTVSVESDGEKKGANMFQILLAIVRGAGWVLMLADIVCLLAACTVLFKIFQVLSVRTLKIFMCTVIVSTIFALIYGIFFIIICIILGQSFPVFELIFVLLDFGLWLYFILVLNAYKTTLG